HPAADGAGVDLRNRHLRPVDVELELPEPGLPDLPGGSDGDLVPLDGPALRRHLPRQAGIPAAIRGSANLTDALAVFERCRRHRRLDRRRARDVQDAVESRSLLELELALVARNHDRGLRADRSGHLRRKRVDASARGADTYVDPDRV